MATPEQEIARRIKEQYFAEESSNVLGSAATAIGRSAPVRWSLSSLGKVLDVLDTGLNAVTLGLRPIVTSLDPKLEEVYKREGFNVTPSSLIEEAIPGKSIWKKALKLTGDVLLDPITYTGVGLTAKGRALAKAGGAGREGLKIGLDTKLGKELGKVFGRTPSAQLIKEAKQGLPISLAEQARRGDRALLKFMGQPIVKGTKFYEMFETSRNLVRQNKYASAYRALFSTHTTNPEFDAMERNFINLLQYRKGEVIASAKAIEDQLAEISIKLGIPRERINKMVTEVVERPTKPRQILKKVVTRVFPEATEVKQKLVNVLRIIGYEKEAAYWAKKGVLSKEFQKFLKEARVPGSPVARLLERGEVYTTIRGELDPLRAMVEDVTFLNESFGAKVEFVSQLVGWRDSIVTTNLIPATSALREALLDITKLNLRNVEVNTKSKYILRAYKESVSKDSDQVYSTLGEILKRDLAEGKVNIDQIKKDLFKEIEVKPPTTKPVIRKKDIEEAERGAWDVIPIHRVEKLSRRFEKKNLLDTTIGRDSRYNEVFDYYSTHYFRPKTIAQAEGNEALRKLSRGQLAEILKASRGDVYDKLANLINRGLIDNRNLMPSGNIRETFNQAVRYNESEVAVSLWDSSLLPSGGRMLPGKYSDSAIIPRGVFEEEISNVKRLIYDTKQILPVVHGTRDLQKIITEGALKPAASIGTGTQTRDYAAGVLGKIFASVPNSYYGARKIILPLDILKTSSALPGDGLLLPANAMVIKHLLSRGEDGVLDVALRRLAIMDWEQFARLKYKLSNRVDPGHLSNALINSNFAPDIHLTGPIPVEQFLGIVKESQQEVDELVKLGLDISRMQLIDRNGRYLMRFFDSKGNPNIERELLITPNITEIMSRSNLLGVAVDAERQAAAIEKFLQVAKIPQGESVYTYLRKTHPNLINPEVKPLLPKVFQETLDNYGLLSDESLDALAVNVFDLREQVLGKGLTANELGQTPAGLLASTEIIINNKSFEDQLAGLPAYQAMSAEEKGRFARGIWKQIKAHERGHNVFTMSLRIVPDEIQYEFADIAARATHLDIVRNSKGKVVADEKLSEVLRAYSKKGEDEAIKTLVGVKAFERIKKIPVDYEQMKSVVRKMVAHVDELFAEAHSIYQINPTKLKKVWPEAFGVMRKVYSRKGWKTEWVKENTQIPHAIAVKHPEIFDIATAVRRLQHEYIETEVASGVKVARMVRDARGTQYTRHVVAPEIREFLKARYFKGAKVWTDEMQAQITRKFRRMSANGIRDGLERKIITPVQANLLKRKTGLKHLDQMVKDGALSKENAASLIHIMTVDEVNRLASLGRLKILKGQKFDRFFDPDPVSQVRVRGIEGARAATGAEYFNGVKTWGIMTKNIPPGHKYVKPAALKGWAFPDEIADHIDRYYERVSIPKGLDPFLDLFDNVQDVWKAWTLSIFPAYHTRNVVGNIWNNYLAGLVNPNYYKRAWTNLWDELNQRNLDKVAVTTGYGQKYTLAEVIDLMKRNDIWRVGQYGRDIESVFEKEVKGALKHLRDNKLMNAGRQIGTFLEAKAYMAHFMWRLEQGYSPGAAAQSVKKYLFDYADLTDFEKNVMKRIFPFYTWTRKNIPLQLEALATQPGKPLGVLKAKMAYETNDDGTPDERYLPDWMVQNFPVRVRFNKVTGNHEYFLLGSWLPVADIDRIFRPHRMMANMLTPFLKEPLQQFANYDFFSERPIDKGGEYERFATINMPKRVSHILRNIRVLSEADKLTKDDLSLESKISGLATGKLYPYDVQKSRMFRQIEGEEQDRNLKGQLRRAQRKGDKGEVDRVLKAIQKHKQRQAEFQRRGP